MINLNFKKLKGEGFKSIGPIIDLNLENNGICLIQGINKYDSKSISNGAGKSTLLEMILWCIYGKTSEGMTNDVVNSVYNQGCFVEVNVEIDNVQYLIRRSIGHKEYKTNVSIFKNTNDISSRLKTDTDKIIKDILHIDIDVFLQLIFLSQTFSNRFALYAPKARKDLLESLYNINDNLYLFIEIYKSRESEMINMMSELNNDVIKLQTQIDNETVNINRIKLDNLNKQQSINSIKENNFNTSKVQLDILETKVNNLDILIENLRNKKNTFEEQKLNICSKIINFNNKLNLLKDENNKFSENDICPTCGTLLEDYSKNEHIQNRLIEIKNEMNEISLQLIVISDKEKNINESLSNVTTKIKNNINLKSDSFEKLTEYRRKYNEEQIKTEKINSLEEQIIQNDNLIIQYNKNIENYIISLDNKNKEKELINNKLDIIKHIIRLANNQFKSYLLNDIINMLNVELENLSKSLYDDEIIKIIGDNKLDIMIGDKYYEQRSGGEKKKCDIAMIIAQRKLAQRMNSISSNILVVDEIFDAVDAESFKVIIELLNDEIQDVESTFIISHRNIQEIPFDNVITIIKDKDQISRIY